MTHALTEGGESSQVSDSEGSGEPPKKGDICIDECGQPQVFDGNGWVPWRFVVTGTGQITPTDSPLEWLLGTWKTPFQVADDVAVLGFAKIAGGGGGWKKVMSGSEVGKLLSKDGFTLVRQNGSHMIYKHTSGATIPVPNHRSIASGTLQSIRKMYNSIIFP